MKTFIRSVGPSLPKNIDQPIDVMERPNEHTPKERLLRSSGVAYSGRYSYHEIVAIHVREDLS